MWELFQQNAISPDTRLTSRYRPSERRADTRAVLEAIQDAKYDERKRRESLGLRGGPPADRAPRHGPLCGSSPSASRPAPLGDALGATRDGILCAGTPPTLRLVPEYSHAPPPR
jgi:hypothetical protein